MKKSLALLLTALLTASVLSPLPAAFAQEAPPEAAPAAEAPATLAIPAPFSIGDGEDAIAYDFSDTESAKAFIDAYADNVQSDPEFESHIETALTLIRDAGNPFYGSFWSIIPPLLAILLALVTKEVYSSLIVGILAGGLLYARGAFEPTIVHVISDGFIASIADAYNIGILIFLVLLGALVAMMNKTGGSAAFGRWAATHIHSRLGAQVATGILGLLIFVDDYFNCLTVGSVMRPVTDAKKVSRAKLAYLIDATAAPICIIAPVSSWAAAVAGFAKGAGAESGFALFIAAIPYNFYAILTIVTLFFIAATGFDFGPMRLREQAALLADPETDSNAETTSPRGTVRHNPNGRVADLLIPVVVLIAACVIGLIYSGGYFDSSSECYRHIVDYKTVLEDGTLEQHPGAFSNADASVGLVYGAAFTIVFSVIYFLFRRVVSFKDCMASLPEGFNAMVPAILILCCAWTLKTMTDSLGAKVFISQLINGPAASLQAFLPAIIFVIALVLAFSTGTSWGTFGILIPIVLAALPGNDSMIIAVSACMAGAVCGDHCSPISDTTIMASAGAQCNHVEHVSTQLPYALLVAFVSFVSYAIAAFIHSWVIMLPIASVLMIATLSVMMIFSRKASAS
jgi:Na+/H+ antiporter NhaC